MSELEEIAAFIRTVDEGGFSAAARALGRTPSAVSRQVARLEERLGVRLLQRTTRRLGLTEAGAGFHAAAARAVADLEEARHAATGASAAPRGRLRVAASLAFGRRQLAPLLPAFMAAHPGLSISLRLADEVMDLIAAGVDVAIRSAPLPDSRLVARRLATDRRVVCATPGYLARVGRPRRPSQLEPRDCLRFIGASSLNEWPFRGGAVRARGAFEANSAEALREAALAGLGVARLARFLVGPDLKDGRLVALLEDWRAGEDGAIWAVYPQTRFVAPKVRAFIDFLAAELSPTPPWDR